MKVFSINENGDVRPGIGTHVARFIKRKNGKAIEEVLSYINVGVNGPIINRYYGDAYMGVEFIDDRHGPSCVKTIYNAEIIKKPKDSADSRFCDYSLKEISPLSGLVDDEIIIQVRFPIYDYSDVSCREYIVSGNPYETLDSQVLSNTYVANYEGVPFGGYYYNSIIMTIKINKVFVFDRDTQNFKGQFAPRKYWYMWNGEKMLRQTEYQHMINPDYFEKQVKVLV